MGLAIRWTQVPTSNEHEKEVVHRGQGVCREQASMSQPGLRALAPQPKQLWVAPTFSAQGLHLSGRTLNATSSDSCSVSLRKVFIQNTLSPGTLHINPSKHPYKFFQFLKQKQCNRSGIFNLCSIDILGQIILYWRGYPVHCGILAAFLAHSSC